MTQRREAIAAMIATRGDLEDEIQSLQRRVSSKERQVIRLPAQGIASTENPLDDAKARHVDICKMISSEELALRRLLSEINEHRRDLKLMAASA